MTPALKSLLITTVLTLPSVFAADDTLLENESDARPAVTTVATVATPQSSLSRLPVQLMQLVVGHANATFGIGYLNGRDVAALALTSKKFNALAQPVLNATKWLSLLTPRILLQTTDPLDTAMLTLFKVSLDLTFDNLLNIKLAINHNFSMITVTPETHTKLVDRINNIATFTDIQKQILINILPNATPWNILDAARTLLLNFEAQYPDRAAALYELLAKHPNATLMNILYAANALGARGDQYHDRAAVLYELFAEHPNAYPLNILDAANALRDLGTQYHDRAAALSERCVNLITKNPENILDVANIFLSFGDQYHDRAVTLYERYVNLTKAEP